MKSKKIDIEKYLSSERYTTRKELAEKTGLSDRNIREKISELKKERVVIYSSSKAGYRLAKELKSITQKEREEELSLVIHSLNDCKSRTKQLNKQKKNVYCIHKKS